MDWSIVGREAKKVITDVIDQSLGTHFFRSSTPPAQPQTAPNPETNPQNPNSSENKLNPEEQKALDLKQKAQTDSVRAELEAAIATQRQNQNQTQKSWCSQTTKPFKKSKNQTFPQT